MDKNGDIREGLTEKLRVFIEQYYYKELMNLAKKGGASLDVNFSDIAKFDLDVAELLLESPLDVFEYFEEAIKEFDLPDKYSKKKINARFYNLPKSQHLRIRDIRSNHLGKLMGISGLIRQASDVRPKVKRTYFTCPSCNQTIIKEQKESKFKTPNMCPNCGKKGRFILKDKRLVDIQRLLIEESPEDLSGGEQPKRIAVYICDDLLDPKLERKRYPGNKIKLSGIIREVQMRLRTGGKSTKYDLLIDVNHLDTIEEEFGEITITKKNKEEIEKLAKDKQIFKKLIGSIAPSIYGHEDIKLALALQMFGGVLKERKDGTRMRGDIHVFLIGDPGSGKSEMLKYISNLAPKARYVSGKSASGAGITATVVKDEFMRGWALEAGALVLANKGICCVDELDKMNREDTSSMHEALEQQKISISKANIQATLNAQASVLAAANPKFGRFDPFSPISQQIDLPSTLLNRFDLIFPIRDVPDAEKDEKIADHVLDLQKDIEGVKSKIDRNLLMKFIAYAKQNYFPKLSKAAKQEILSFYVSLRGSVSDEEAEVRPIPISARQLQGVVRMAEASARIRLSRTVTKKDAKRSISLLSNCMKAVGTDPETGKFDIDRFTGGVTASQRSKIHVVKATIDKLEEKIGKVIPISDIIKAAGEEGVDTAKSEEVINNLIKTGDLYSPRHGLVQKI